MGLIMLGWKFILIREFFLEYSYDNDIAMGEGNCHTMESIKLSIIFATYSHLLIISNKNKTKVTQLVEFTP
jgi:hypothetical protein